MQLYRVPIGQDSDSTSLQQTAQIISNSSKVTANTVIKVGFEVLTAVSTKMAVFWVVAPCSLVEVYQR
jgi:hypothetical protein